MLLVEVSLIRVSLVMMSLERGVARTRVSLLEVLLIKMSMFHAAGFLTQATSDQDFYHCHVAELMKKRCIASRGIADRGVAGKGVA